MQGSKQNSNSNNHHSALPEGWRIIELGKCSKIERGKFAHRPRNAPQFYGGDMPFVQTGDVSNSNGHIKLYSQTLNELGCSISKVFPKGTILITIAANIGDCGILEFDSACPDSLIAITPQSNLDTRYLNYFLHTQKPRIHYLAPQGAQKNINVNFLDQLPIVVPPLGEQQQIADVLSTWDTAIEATEKLIAAKVKLKKGLMQQLLTGKRRFQEFAGQEWKEVRLGDFLKESRIEGSNGALARKITVKLYGKGVIGKRDRTKGSQNTKYYIRKTGQFIYSKLDFLNGAFGIVPQNLDGYESTLDLPAFDISDNLDSHWLLHLVNRESFYANFHNAAEGGRKARRVQPDELLRTKIKFPSIEEQKRIAAVLNAYDKEIELLVKQRDALKEQKRGLMQQLLTGKIRVKVGTEEAAFPA